MVMADLDSTTTSAGRKAGLGVLLAACVSALVVNANTSAVTILLPAISADLNAPITSGDLVIDEASYSARFRGQPLDLTYKEFELLKYLAQHPGRVFTRAQLLQEVWGYDYYGGTRTVDVHVRRLRAKLGPDHEALIGTVRNVGYRLVPDKATSA